MEFDLNQFFNLSLDMLCIAGLDGYFKLINTAFERNLGWSADELLSKPFVDFVHPEDVENTMNELSNLRDGQATISFMNRYRSIDGSYRHLLWTGRVDLDNALLYAVARDITDLSRTQDRFGQMMESSPTAMLMISDDGTIFMANREAERLFGYDHEELSNRKLNDLIPDRIKGVHDGYCHDFFNDRIARPMGLGLDLAAKRKNGVETPVEIGLTPVETEEGRFVICTVNDLTKRKPNEREIKSRIDALGRLASIDPLTGVLSRNAMFEQCELQLKISRRTYSDVSLAMFDIDKFKEVNDSLGHQEGDRVLKTVAALARESQRASDILGRYGGEEFAILLPATGRVGAAIAAEKIRTSIEDYDWPSAKISASFGVATVERISTDDSDDNSNARGDTLDKLFEQADRALYYSKNSGRNRTTHFDDM